MTVENTNNKMPPQQMGESSDYTFNFAVLLSDPTEVEAMSSIKATVELADGSSIELSYGSSGSDGYSVTLNSNGVGGKITVNDKRTTDDYITIYRQYSLKQEADYQDFNAAPADTYEQCFDKSIMVAQQLQEEISRAIKSPITSSISDLTLPSPVAGRALKWNDEGTGLENSGMSVDEIDDYVKTAEENAELTEQLATVAQQQAAIATDSATASESALTACEQEVLKAKAYAEQSGSKGMPTDICKNLKIEFDTVNRKVKLNWQDPNDTINSLGQILSSWKGTIILCKENSYPSDYDDGTVILNSTVKNQYKNQAYEYDVPESIADITTLKFRAFPYSVNDVYNKDSRNCFDSVVIYEMLFDKLNSNVFGNVRYPQGCENEHFTPVKMDYDNNVFDYGSWLDTFIMNLVKPCMLYNQYSNNIGLNIVGKLGNDNGVFSGFTTSIYANMSYIPANVDEINSFEICADFTTGTTISTGQETILGNSTTNAHSPQLAIVSKKLQWDMPNSSYAYIGAMSSDNELEAETQYTTKLKYNKTDSLLSAYMATSGGADVKIAEMSVPSIGWNEVMRLGLDLTANPFNGSINIKGCYIEINNEKVFDGSKYECLQGQVMEYLNPDDYTVNMDNEASHVADETCAANAMAEWDADSIWIKIEEYLPGKYHAYIANKKVDASYKNWLQYNKNGDIVTKYYHALYDGCNVNNIIRSISGKSPCVNMAGNTQIEYAKANGYGYDVYEARFLLLRFILLMLISRTTDSQTAFGKGRNSGGTSSSYNQLVSGTLDKKGAFFGDNNNGDVKVFHSSSAWGNVWNIMQGIIQISGKLYIKLTPNTNDGSTAGDYNSTGEGYIDTGVILGGTSGGYISDVELYDNCVFLPKTASGSSSTYIPDGLWWNTANVGFARFGSCSYACLLVGSFACTLYGPVADSEWAYGVSLSYTPS